METCVQNSMLEGLSLEVYFGQYTIKMKIYISIVKKKNVINSQSKVTTYTELKPINANILLEL